MRARPVHAFRRAWPVAVDVGGVTSDHRPSTKGPKQHGQQTEVPHSSKG